MNASSVRTGSPVIGSHLALTVSKSTRGNEVDPTDAWNIVRSKFQKECLDNLMICSPFIQGASFFRPWNAFVKQYKPRIACLSTTKSDVCFVPLGPVGLAASERTDRFEAKLGNSWSTVVKESFRTVVTKKEGDVRKEIDLQAEGIFRIGVPTIAPGEIRIDLQRVAEMRDIENYGTKKTPKSVFVIHEAVYATILRITTRVAREIPKVGEWRDVLVGFTLTKYHTKKDKIDEGWLTYPVQEYTPMNFDGYFLHPSQVNWPREEND